jgi:hypothetical protein
MTDKQTSLTKEIKTRLMSHRNTDSYEVDIEAGDGRDPHRDARSALASSDVIFVGLFHIISIIEPLNGP